MGEKNPLAEWGKDPDMDLLRDFTAKKPVPEASSRSRILEFGGLLQRDIEKAVFYLTYLTGARITEALMIRREDIDLEHVEGEPIITIKLKTLKKRRGAKVRMIPIWVSPEHNPSESEMWQHVKPWVQRTDTGLIFPYRDSVSNARKRIWYYFKRDITVRTSAVKRMRFIDDYEFQMYPHYLRHCRLTHMAQLYGFDEIKLMRYAGWSSTKPSSVYVHYNWMELAKWMMKA